MFVAGGVFFESKILAATQGKRLQVGQLIDTAPNPDRMHKREYFAASAVAIRDAFSSGGLCEHIRSDPWLFENAHRWEADSRISPAPGGIAKMLNGAYASELTGIFMRDWCLAPIPVRRNQGFMPEFSLLIYD